MNIDDFTEFKAGRLVPVTNQDQGGQAHTYYTFIPHPLPPSWAFTQKLFGLIGEARQTIGDLNGSGSRLKDPFLLLKPLQRREALRSNSLEGTYVTPKELLLYEKSRKELQNKTTDSASRWQDVFNYYRAIQHGQQRIDRGDPIDRKLICDLHKILMSGARGKGKSLGEIRQVQVYVGKTFTPPAPSELGACLLNFEAYHQNPEFDAIDPLVRAFIAHYQFEVIHPFRDGNGRIGRVLLALSIYKWTKLSFPWLYLSESFDNHRRDYFDGLYGVSTNGEWEEWIDLCARATIEQATAAIQRCDTLAALEDTYHNRIAKGSARLHKLVDMLFASPFLSTVEVRDQLKIGYPMASRYMQQLLELRIVTVAENEFPRMYIADQILEIAYAE